MPYFRRLRGVWFTQKSGIAETHACPFWRMLLCHPLTRWRTSSNSLRAADTEIWPELFWFLLEMCISTRYISVPWNLICRKIIFDSCYNMNYSVSGCERRNLVGCQQCVFVLGQYFLFLYRIGIFTPFKTNCPFPFENSLLVQCAGGDKEPEGTYTAHSFSCVRTTFRSM